MAADTPTPPPAVPTVTLMAGTWYSPHHVGIIQEAIKDKTCDTEGHTIVGLDAALTGLHDKGWTRSTGLRNDIRVKLYHGMIFDGSGVYGIPMKAGEEIDFLIEYGCKPAGWQEGDDYLHVAHTPAKLVIGGTWIAHESMLEHHIFYLHNHIVGVHDHEHANDPTALRITALMNRIAALEAAASPAAEDSEE